MLARATRFMGGAAFLLSAVVAPAAVAVLVAPAALSAQTATWDDLSANGGETPAGYAGHNWYTGDGPFGSGTGRNSGLAYGPFNQLGCHSAPNCATSQSEATGHVNGIRIESLTTNASDKFTFSGFFAGAYAGGNFFGPPLVEAQGFAGGSTVPLFTTFFAVPTDGSFVQQSFTSSAVNKLLFLGVDNVHKPYDGSFLLDDATFSPSGVTTTPEPSSMALLGTGLVGLIPMIRRRIKA